MTEKNYSFKYDERLNIKLPILNLEWEQYDEQDRMDILEKWEIIRGSIPDQIKAFEAIIGNLLARLNKETDFNHSCSLNSQISEVASCIHDLNVWYRINQQISPEKSHQ